MGHARHADALQLGREWLRMVDHVVGSQLAHPGLGLGARGGADHREAGQLARQLGHDRADPAGRADDQQGALRLVGDLQPVEQHFPGGDGRQRQRRGLCKRQRGRHAPDDALVHTVQLRIAARAGDVTGVKDTIARLEQRDLRAHRLDHAGRIPAQHLVLAGRRRGALAHLGVDRVDRDGVHPHLEVARAGAGRGQRHVEQRLGGIDGQGLAVGNGFHLTAPRGWVR